MSLVSVLLLLAQTGLSSSRSGLQCYVGNCSSWEDCRRPGLITDCPPDHHYTACLTFIDQKSYGALSVVKRCGFVSVCSPDPAYWWSDECDRKSDEDSYTCTSCCHTNNCNAAPGGLHHLHHLHHLHLPAKLLLLHFILNKYSFSMGWG